MVGYEKCDNSIGWVLSDLLSHEVRHVERQCIFRLQWDMNTWEQIGAGGKGIHKGSKQTARTYSTPTFFWHHFCCVAAPLSIYTHGLVEHLLGPGLQKEKAPTWLTDRSVQWCRVIAALLDAANIVHFHYCRKLYQKQCWLDFAHYIPRGVFNMFLYPLYFL